MKKGKRMATPEEVALEMFEKRDLIRATKRNYVCAKRDEIYDRLVQAKASQDVKAVRRLRGQLRECEKRMAVIDVQESEDHLCATQTQLAMLEKAIKESRNLSERTFLMKRAEEKENDVFDASIGLRDSKARLAQFNSPKAKKKTRRKKVVSCDATR